MAKQEKTTIQLLLEHAPRTLLTPEEEKQLGDTIQAGLNDETPAIKILVDEAKDKLFKHNMKLVVGEAYKYSGYKMPIEDLVQEGMIGLMTAVKKFDPERGCRFSTAAVPWIRQAITRYIAEYRKTIRYPVHVSEQLNKINKTKNELYAELEREPTVEEISKALNGKLSVEKILELQRVTQPITSMNVIVGDEQDTELSEFIPDEGEPTPREWYNIEEGKSVVAGLLECLDNQEQQIIIWRYGLNNGIDYTLEEIGDVLGLTRERIRQIEKDAITKMRIYARNQKITR